MFCRRKDVDWVNQPSGLHYPTIYEDSDMSIPTAYILQCSCDWAINGSSKYTLIKYWHSAHMEPIIYALPKKKV